MRTLVEQGILHRGPTIPGRQMHSWPVRVGGSVEQHTVAIGELPTRIRCTRCETFRDFPAALRAAETEEEK